MINRHHKYMDMALRLASRGRGKTSPNPMVGSLVIKGGKIVGRGYHKRAGLPHAEVYALDEAKEKAREATIYVTLEPCCHFGRTPPCADRIIEAGIKKAVIAMKDPNPLNDGKGIDTLRWQGVKVMVGVLEEKAKKLNEAYIKFITKGLPFVVVKVAESLDGKIATKEGDSRWITGEKSRAYVHRLRGQVDCVLVGVNTIIRDDPLLTDRRNLSKKKQPIKVIVDSRLKTPPSARIFSGQSPAPVLIACTRWASKKRREILEKKGAKVLTIRDNRRRVCIKSLLRRLAKMGIVQVLVEGGGEMVGSLFEEGLVDRALFFIAPEIIGGREAPTSVEGEGIGNLSKVIRLKDIKVRRFAQDLLVEGYVK